MQNQLPPSGTPAYSNASLNGTYAAFCSGSEVDLNWVTFDGNGGQIGVDAYDDGAFGDSPYIGTYSVNADGTFTGNFSGIYSIFTMTGVIDNGNSEIEFSYDQSGVGGVVACVGESTYGPVGANPVAATPSFSPAPGIYALPQTITLSDTTAGAVIHYTTDGSAPSIGSPVYSGPVAVTATASIQAIAVASGYSNSAIAAGTYFAGRNLSQTITFPTIPNQTYPAQQVSLNATASSGLPVSYAVLSGPGTLTGNILTITGVGSVTVQASQSGSTQYAAASPVSQAATVNQSTTTLVLTSTSNPSALDQPITLAATIMPQNGGQSYRDRHFQGWRHDVVRGCGDRQRGEPQHQRTRYRHPFHQRDLQWQRQLWWKRCSSFAAGRDQGSIYRDTGFFAQSGELRTTGYLHGYGLFSGSCTHGQRSIAEWLNRTGDSGFEVGGRKILDREIAGGLKPDYSRIRWRRQQQRQHVGGSQPGHAGGDNHNSDVFAESIRLRSTRSLHRES